VSPAIVQAIGHSLDIPNVSEQAAKALAPDVEYKLRELIQVPHKALAANAIYNLQVIWRRMPRSLQGTAAARG
jgi:hypothetical protein